MPVDMCKSNNHHFYLRKHAHCREDGKNHMHKMAVYNSSFICKLFLHSCKHQPHALFEMRRDVLRNPFLMFCGFQPRDTTWYSNVASLWFRGSILYLKSHMKLQTLPRDSMKCVITSSISQPYQDSRVKNKYLQLKKMLTLKYSLKGIPWSVITSSISQPFLLGRGDFCWVLVTSPL